MLVADGLDEAIIGVARIKGHDDIVIYDYAACVALIVRNNECTEEEAIEHLEFNTLDAYVGPGTPGYLFTPDPDEGETPRQFADRWAGELQGEEEEEG